MQDCAYLFLLGGHNAVSDWCLCVVYYLPVNYLGMWQYLSTQWVITNGKTSMFTHLWDECSIFTRADLPPTSSPCFVSRSSVLSDHTPLLPPIYTDTFPFPHKLLQAPLWLLDTSLFGRGSFSIVICCMLALSSSLPLCCGKLGAACVCSFCHVNCHCLVELFFCLFVCFLLTIINPNTTDFGYVPQQ